MSKDYKSTSKYDSWTIRGGATVTSFIPDLDGYQAVLPVTIYSLKGGYRDTVNLSPDEAGALARTLLAGVAEAREDMETRAEIAADRAIEARMEKDGR